MAAPGSIVWHDLTVPDAPALRDFYARVIGFESEGVSMGDYEDYNLRVAGQPVAGVCHARGLNATVPPQWLVYFQVADLEKSLKECEALGGKVLVGPRAAGPGRFAVVEDPAGAICALYGD